MYLSIQVTQLWEELKSNRLTKYGTVTAVTAISKLHNVISSHCNFWWRGKHTVEMFFHFVLSTTERSRSGVSKLGCDGLAEIRRSTGYGNTVVWYLDLASLFSVQQFVHKYTATEYRLYILINNAVMMCIKSLTEDGYETQFAVNHLGHFRLPSRISIAHKGVRSTFVTYNFNKAPYDSLVSYRQSKLANMLFTRELAQRIKGLLIRTELGCYVLTRHPLLSALLFLPALLLIKTPSQGAQMSVYCAFAEGLESHSGCYFSDCKLKEPAPESKDDAAINTQITFPSLLIFF
uniref:Zgc:153441 n=1 Tax=Cyprinus carpio TaxID=7962 RepID=A0A8C1UTG7_CYPCA